DVKRGRNARPFPASPGSRERTRAREAAESQPATHLERLLGWRACPPGPRRRDRGARERDRRVAVVVYSSPSASPRRTAPHRHPSAARGVISSPPSPPYPRHANIPMGKSSSLDPPCQKIPNASSQGCSSSGHGAYSRSTQSAVPSVSVGYWKLRRGLGILWLRAAPAPPHGMASGGHLPAPRQRCSLQYEHSPINPESEPPRFEILNRVQGESEKGEPIEMPMETREGRRRPAEGKPVVAEARERCPRCESRDTKFCYYNNYNMSQPRHFCKSCRRYWTLGGSLRNVPIGGSSRKRLRPFPAPAAADAVVVAALRPGRALPGHPPPAPQSAELGQGPLLPSGPVQAGLLGLDEPFLSCRGGFGLGLGLGLGCGAGAAEEMGFGLAPTLLWPPSLLDEAADTWRVSNGGVGDCLAAPGTGPPAAAWPDLAISAPAEGGAGPAREVS
ncbi:hypothetical protein BHE74_00053674, partial [Ensete ventricosum]